MEWYRQQTHQLPGKISPLTRVLAEASHGPKVSVQLLMFITASVAYLPIFFSEISIADVYAVRILVNANVTWTYRLV